LLPRISVGAALEGFDLSVGPAETEIRSNDPLHPLSLSSSADPDSPEDVEPAAQTASVLPSTFAPRNLAGNPVLVQPNGPPGAQDAALPATSPFSFPGILFMLCAIALPLFALLYHRLRSDSVADHPTRARLLEVIRQTPGVSDSALARATSLHPTTVAYHGRLLKLYGHVDVREIGNEKAYFAAGANLSPVDKQAAAMGRKEFARRVLDALLGTHARSMTELAAELGTTRQNLAWHLKRLEACGLVRTMRVGKRVVVQRALACPTGSRVTLANESSTATAAHAVAGL
jgi:predicted transcriptional regulator